MLIAEDDLGLVEAGRIARERVLSGACSLWRVQCISEAKDWVYMVDLSKGEVVEDSQIEGLKRQDDGSIVGPPITVEGPDGIPIQIRLKTSPKGGAGFKLDLQIEPSESELP